MKYGYARISTKDQCLDLQIDALKEAGCKKIFQDCLKYFFANTTKKASKTGKYSKMQKNIPVFGK